MKQFPFERPHKKHIFPVFQGAKHIAYTKCHDIMNMEICRQLRDTFSLLLSIC